MTAPDTGVGHNRPDPTASLRRVLGASRLPFVLSLIVILLSVAQIVFLLSANHSAVIRSDSYSYLMFAKELRGGDVRMTGLLANTIEELFENEELIEGPIWNTHVTADGRTVFTIAVGYPLALAVAWTVGGLWLAMKLNIVLLALLFLLVGMFLWDRMGRDTVALSVAGCSILILVASQSSRDDTLLQLAHTWREPLFYLCVLGAAWAVARYASSGRLRSVATAGVLLGFACAVKEANVVYAFVIGLFIVFCRRPFELASTVRVGGVYVSSGIAGCLPLLLQNTCFTGNPFRSLQMMRATAGALSMGPEAGWSPGNIPVTARRYAEQYYAEYGVALLFVFGILALIGVVVGRRTTLVHVMGLLLAIHVALYVPWGNADFRHSYFAHIPLSFYCALGLVHLVTWAVRPVPGIELYRFWVPLIPLVLLAAKPPPWPVPGTPPFLYDDAVALTREIEQESGEASVLLCNRELRNTLDVYGTLPVIRLHDLAGFHPERDAAEVVRYLLDGGWEVHFLNNPDRDPANFARVDWGKKDEAMLREHFDLIPAFSMPRTRNGLERFVSRPELTAFQVMPWTNTVVRRSLVVPDEGSAFIFVNPGAETDGLEFSLDGNSIDKNPSGGCFVPAMAGPGEDVLFEASAGGEIIPALSDTRLVGWFAEISQPIGADASSSDASFFPGGVNNSVDVGWRNFTNSTVQMRVPVRHRNNLFTTVGLIVALNSDVAQVRISLPGGETYVGEPRATTAYFPVPAQHVREASAGFTEFTVHADEGVTIKLMRAESYACRSRLTLPGFGDALGVGLTGQLASTEVGVGPHPWAVHLDGAEFRHGECMADPNRSLNRFSMAISPASGGYPQDVEFVDAGLMGAQWSFVGDRMDLTNFTTCSGLNPFMEDFYEREEEFWWSKGESRVFVPVRGGRMNYRLRLDLSGGPDGRNVPVVIRFAGGEAIRVVAGGRSVAELSVTAANELVDGIEPLRFEADVWQPQGESRSLGFQLFGLQWEPVQ